MSDHNFDGSDGNDDWADSVEDVGAGELASVADGGAWESAGLDGTSGTDPYPEAAAAWTENVTGCSCAIAATAPGWENDLYTQLVESPDQPIVWANSAPDESWTSFSDVASAPNTVVSYPANTTIGGGQDPGWTVSPDVQPTTVVIGGQDPGWTAPEGVEPTTVTIGGQEPGWTVSPDVQPTTAIVGGQDPGYAAPAGFEPTVAIVGGDTTFSPDPAAPGTGGFTTVVGGPQSTDTLMGSLQSMMDMAIRNGDLLSQARIQAVIDSQVGISRLWSMPEIVVY